jgi:DNA-binding CsgD family transcriptional regulator
LRRFIARPWVAFSGSDMDLYGSVSCLDLAGVLDAASGFTDALPGEDDIERLFAALVRLVGFDVALWTWTDVVASVTVGGVTPEHLRIPARGDPRETGNDCAARAGASPGRDCDDRARLLLRLLRPHLEYAFRRATQRAPKLTPREKQVLALVRDGLGNASIARVLGVAESTVVKHLEHVYERTGAHSRTQALRLCSTALD